jgi:hypothetical protein
MILTHLSFTEIAIYTSETYFQCSAVNTLQKTDPVKEVFPHLGFHFSCDCTFRVHKVTAVLTGQPML